MIADSRYSGIVTGSDMPDRLSPSGTNRQSNMTATPGHDDAPVAALIFRTEDWL